mmetsp:Transcript_12804/g.20841  ORF Transcript_12804/g.20841 Transcript_12804/m.20841 type:complete len:186 (-) Transcript_12804:235-792(-)|eukprot:CAMPEP_0171522334 /NCGR_PEP_ID=MMETSP0959-20130129/7682_1 /TAXON_ID=87120 /ORGANISM="Aurantiochytrium limacinum, Strain ATCCMYA-1381" /LENGTH=185 /DNA_ID=CAMNT_0012062439 /DNA_START=99 /DNA_END=656 /DNA_ORIENTATION=+
MDLCSEFKGVSLDDRVEDDRLYEGKVGRDFSQEDEDLICEGHGGTVEDNAFDLAVGVLEEVIMDPDFVDMQTTFCKKHCALFDEEGEENKLEYTTLFNEYTDLIESYLEACLRRRIPGFRLDDFAYTCEQRRHEICGDVFDILLSLGDYDEFKELMISHKTSNHHPAHDLSSDPTIFSSVPMLSN